MALSDTWLSVTHPAGRRSGVTIGVGRFSVVTSAMRGPPGRWKRALIGPRGLVRRRSGADTARSGIAERAMRCDSIMRVCTLFGSVAATTTRDCAEATTLISVSSAKREKCRVM